jgi:hypothetical protein
MYRQNWMMERAAGTLTDQAEKAIVGRLYLYNPGKEGVS